MKRVRLTQLDGKLPNLALMKLAHWHRRCGDEVIFSTSPRRDVTEAPYDVVYGSAIFSFSAAKVDELLWHWPAAIVGGTGTSSTRTVEDLILQSGWALHNGYEHYDYGIYPDFKPSLGFTQRGCRFNCDFCVVPRKEGRPRSVNTINDIWRGGKAPRKILLLDNDFFGNPEWAARLEEVRAGKFKVCFNQGINLRVLKEDQAEALASIEYRNAAFKERLLYTAWDNLGEERTFFRGVDRLEAAGIPPSHLMVYMLTGYDPEETWPRIWHRFDHMVDRKMLPYAMVYDRSRKDLLAFQKWVNMGLYRIIPWNEFEHRHKSRESAR